MPMLLVTTSRQTVRCLTDDSDDSNEQSLNYSLTLEYIECQLLAASSEKFLHSKQKKKHTQFI